MVQRAVAELGNVDTLVNCAARVGGRPHALDEIAAEAFWEDMNTKVLGFFRWARAVAPVMRSSGCRIINISGQVARSVSIVGSIRYVPVAALIKNLAV